MAPGDPIMVYSARRAMQYDMGKTSTQIHSHERYNIKGTSYHKKNVYILWN